MLASGAHWLRVGAPLARLFVRWICSEFSIILSLSLGIATFVTTCPPALTPLRRGMETSSQKGSIFNPYTNI